ncbi:MAG TPA: sulfotransferase [Gammaproteobacteria bacterium]|nr:sulfotransferase [Gammaproteobacteria bacterium]
MAQKRNGPIFIVGAPRSGTTLLQYMLRSHPAISLPTGESHFIVPLCGNAETFGDLSKVENVRGVLAEMYRRSTDFLDTDLHGMRFDIDSLAHELHEQGRRTMNGIISGLFEKNARGEDKSRWGDKTPYYVLHIPKLLTWFPDAQIIHLIRDGRDVALSLFGRRRDFGTYNTYMAAQYWQPYVDVGQQTGAALADDVYMELRYEDVLQDQAAALKKICEFLGETYTEDLLEYKKSGEAGKTPLAPETRAEGQYRQVARRHEPLAGARIRKRGRRYPSQKRLSRYDPLTASAPSRARRIPAPRPGRPLVEPPLGDAREIAATRRRGIRFARKPSCAVPGPATADTRQDSTSGHHGFRQLPAGAPDQSAGLAVVTILRNAPPGADQGMARPAQCR